MTYPDPEIAAIVDRSARDVAEATQPPPLELRDDPVAYLAWLRNRPPVRPQRSRTPRVYLDRTEIPRGRLSARLAPSQPRRARQQRRLPEWDDAYERAAAVLGQLPDRGDAAYKAARLELGDVPHEQLAVAAAQLATDNARTSADNDGQPRTSVDSSEQGSTDLNVSERAGQAVAAPSCEACGTALEPDGACFTCTHGATP